MRPGLAAGQLWEFGDNNRLYLTLTDRGDAWLVLDLDVDENRLWWSVSLGENVAGSLWRRFA